MKIRLSAVARKYSIGPPSMRSCESHSAQRMAPADATGYPQDQRWCPVSRPLAGSNRAPRAAGNRSYQRPMHFQSAHLGCFLVAIFAPSVHKIINQQACEQNSHRRKCRGKNHVGELKSGLYWCQVNNLSAFGMGQRPPTATG